MIRIVIVEDMPIVMEGLITLINNIDNFEVAEVHSMGQTFLDNVESFTNEIILMDIELPDISGIQATKKALAIKPDLKIIALTMFDIHSYYYDMLEAGAKGFVLKQSNITELQEAIIEVSNNKIYVAKEVMLKILERINHTKIKHSKHNDYYPELNNRDIQLLKYLCKGYTNKELSEVLFLSVKTIEGIKTKLMQKTDSRNSIELVMWALKNKIVSFKHN